MKERSNFTPRSEFLKSEIGIPIENNFPAGFSALLLYFITSRVYTAMFYFTPRVLFSCKKLEKVKLRT